MLFLDCALRGHYPAERSSWPTPNSACAERRWVVLCGLFSLCNTSCMCGQKTFFSYNCVWDRSELIHYKKEPEACMRLNILKESWTYKLFALHWVSTKMLHSKWGILTTMRWTLSCHQHRRHRSLQCPIKMLFGVKFSDEFLVNLALKCGTNTTQDGNKVVE